MFFQSFIQDVRIGFRVLLKEKSFCLLAVFVLALGIGGVTTMFSVINGTMLRGFAYPNADRLAGLQIIDATQKTPFGFPNQIFALDFETIKEQQKSYEMVAAYINLATVNVTNNGTPQRYTGAYVSADFFRILGVNPVIGRDFTAKDDRAGAEKVALISHQLWQRDFSSSSDIVGKGIQINGKPATIIGVMPAGFSFPVNEQIWIPLYSEYPPQPRNAPNAQGAAPAVLGLMKPGVAFDQATAELTIIAKQLSDGFPDTNKKFNTGQVQPLIKQFTPAAIAGLLWIMLSFCVGILLIACVNVMNMQFARAALRAKELAVRSSLGATRFRLIRQMLTESLILAGIGATAGIALAYWATNWLTLSLHAQANPIPAYITFDIDSRVLVFVVGAAVLAALASGLIPAWISSRASAVDALKESGRGNTGRAIGLITRALVVIQILITSILLIGSLLQLQSILRQQTIDYGYDTNGLLAARMALMDGDYPSPESRKLFFDRLLRELRASSDFEAAALTNRFRMTFSGNGKIEIEGKAYKTDDSDRPLANFENVSEGYFDTLGVKIRDGRDFNADDTDMKLPVAIVNAAFAKKNYGTESAIGRRFRTVGNNGRLFGPWRTIIGVVQTVRMQGPFNQPNVDDTGFYVPYFSPAFGSILPGPLSQQFATVIVRPRGIGGAARAHAVTTPLQQTVNKVDPNLPLYFVGTPKEGQETFLAQNRVIALMFSVFGLVAVVLASVGLYGVMSFSVNQRTQEFGIRMALGADNKSILQMVLRQGGFQLVLGLALGLGLALLISLVFGNAISTQLFNISPRDPLTYFAVSLLLGIVAFIATLVPALRATRVDPMVALRAE